MQHRTELAMTGPITEDNCDTIDRKTIRSICDSVGERLRQSFGPDTSRPSRELQQLLDELRRRDRDGPLGA
jgi:hypothetical protein